jgi:hypothetical protein
MKRHFRRAFLLIIILAFLATAVGLVATESGRNLLSDVKDKISGLNPLESGNQSRVQISAELELRAFDVDYSAKVLSIDFSNPSQQIKVNSENLDLSELSSGTLVLSEWAGNLKAGKELSFDGKSSKLSVNSVAVLPEKENLAVKTEKLQFSLVRLDGLSVSKFSYTSTGTVSVNDDQIIANLEDETLSLEDFEGYMELTPERLVLNGTARNIEVEGKTLFTTIT